MDAFAWAETMAENLKAEFGERLAFVGLQGSRARGEAHGQSDIDLVVLLDSLCANDLDRYRAIVQNAPQSNLACGFIGSKSALSCWPRHELFQFYNDTIEIYGTLPAVEPFTKDDALQAARIGASALYHALCHTFVFENDAADVTLQSLCKGAFFILQALHFARTGEYPHTKSELSHVLEGNEARILDISRNWETHRPKSKTEQDELADLLLNWSEAIIRCEFDASQRS